MGGSDHALGYLAMDMLGIRATSATVHPRKRSELLKTLITLKNHAI